MLIKASKAAVITFYETLRSEFGSEIGITISTPGWIESEMTQGKFISKEGVVQVDQEMRDVSTSRTPPFFSRVVQLASHCCLNHLSLILISTLIPWSIFILLKDLTALWSRKRLRFSYMLPVLILIQFFPFCLTYIHHIHLIATLSCVSLLHM